MSEFSWTQLARVVATRDQETSNPIHEEVVRLFTELRTPILRYLYTLGVPLSEGEDVAQETFLALYRHLLDGKPRDNLHGWVFRVARNLALKRLQRTATTGGKPDFTSITDPSANPEQQAVRNQQQRAIQSVIAALPDLDRQCLYLRAEGLRYRDIAQALDISLGSVAQALSRALDKLARAAQR